jgi:acyl-coenzyme A thioesterase PaaI-like protein
MKEVRVKLPLNRRTRNLLGTTFGGSMYAAIDPVYMVMFLQLLGTECIVWDKAATIDFRKPGRSTLHAHFQVTDDELRAVRSIVAEKGKATRTYPVELRDSEGEVCAAFEKVLYFRRK